jgi:hypothetical protein
MSPEVKCMVRGDSQLAISNHVTTRKHVRMLFRVPHVWSMCVDDRHQRARGHGSQCFSPLSTRESIQGKPQPKSRA